MLDGVLWEALETWLIIRSAQHNEGATLLLYRAGFANLSGARMSRAREVFQLYVSLQ